jgi:hypothetical protein
MRIEHLRARSAVRARPVSLRGALSILRRCNELAVLSSVALAQPVFDILGHNPTFFIARGSTKRDIALFAIALVLLPPMVLAAVELVAGAVSTRLARALHDVFLCGFAFLFALAVATKVGAPTGPSAFALAAVAGAVGVLACRTSTVQSLLVPAGAAPVVFAALFLFHSPVSELMLADSPEVASAAIRAQTPVVLVVLDELSTVSLMDRREQIDAGRYPNFAAFARDSTWYRSATTRYWLTEVAVPVILTGLEPDPSLLPTLSQHPRNLFTLVGGSYRIRAVESVTSMCPRAYCAATQHARAVSGSTASLVSDTGVVYLHLVLPKPYDRRLPSISDTWGSFGRSETTALDATQPEACPRNVCLFTKLLAPAGKPTLYFLHTLLPHVPYVYLPSGRRYAIDSRGLRGLDNGRWLSSWEALLGDQRYHLQAVYTDRALGLVLERLRVAGIYDRALVIVTADHGVSFRNGDQRRLPTPTNLQDIAFVPLFVKLPGQTVGRVDDSFATTLDVLPTIGRLLGVRSPWHLDGRPLVAGTLAADGTVAVMKQDRSRVTAPLSALRGRRSLALARQVSSFGTGSIGALYRIGPQRNLIGRAVGSLAIRANTGLRVELTGETLFDAVDPESSFVPALLEGELRGARGPFVPIAIALNGRIAATTYAYGEGRPGMKISAIVPEEAFRAGSNPVELFVIDGANGNIVLKRVQGTDLQLSLLESGGALTIETAAGRAIRVEQGALSGDIHVSLHKTDVAFSGSATRAASGATAESVLVFVEGRSVYRGELATLRPHQVLGEHLLGKGGFAFTLPIRLLPSVGSAQRVRVFALVDDVASELRYAPGDPWPH